MGKKRKRFFANHSKSSAALVSLGIHGVLIVVALSFVAVTVINKPEQTFDAVKVKRPKMAIKKLQVPVKIKKKKVSDFFEVMGLGWKLPITATEKGLF